MDPTELRDALEDPSTWPGSAGPDAIVETHVSVLAFLGERVFKLKKAVDLGFVDARSLEARRRFVAEELRLNRRLSPQIYVGPVELVRTPDGSRRVVAAGSLVGAEVLAVGIEMHRLPQARMLSELLARGEIDNRLLERAASRLVEFHASAERGPEVDACAAPDVVAANALDNLEATRAGVGDVEHDHGALVPASLHAHLEQWTRAFLAEHAQLFARRVAEGRAVDGHGDLHAGNICVLEDQLAIYDCVEFEPRFRRGDVACDLAFLCMDLDLGGYRAFSDYLARRYAELSGDRELARLLPFYKLYRALVRAKVDAVTAGDATRTPEARALAVESAREHFALAASYTLPAALVLTCGLPATGKSWLGKRVARMLGGSMHRSDVRRKQIAGLSLRARRTDGYDQGLYTAENKQRTYDALLGDARADLGHGRSSVIDGSFLQAEWRTPFRALAAELGAPLVLLHLEADEETVKRRIEIRLNDPDEPSEADFEVYKALAAKVEWPDELPAVQHLLVRSGGGPAGPVLRLLERVLLQA